MKLVPLMEALAETFYLGMVGTRNLSRLLNMVEI